MHYVYLPYLTEDDTIESALEKMKQSDARAIVVERDVSECTLYMNRQVLQAWGDQRTYCRDLLEYEGERVVRPYYRAILDSQLPLEPEFERTGADFALPFSDTGPHRIALVITRHEGVAGRVRGAPIYCLCTGDGHWDKSPPKREGQECDFGDGTYLCC